jgi:hypothetical protein
MERFVQLTLQTPTASTVHHPFGAPGGPGLWHHKTLQLPAYVQNVAHAFVRGGMGESAAIHKAVGVVKDWAAGRTPNGRGHVHPDVQAAAARAITEWEKLRAQAHSETAAEAGGKATMTNSGSPLAKVLRLAAESADAGMDDPRTLASALDASLDQACAVLGGADTTTLPPAVQQAIALLYAASYVADELLESMGVPDPDDSDTQAGMSSPLDRVLRLAGSDGSDTDSGDQDESLEGGQLDADGTVHDNDGVSVGVVMPVSMTAGPRYVGQHRSTGMRTAPMASRHAAGTAVLRMHRKG